MFSSSYKSFRHRCYEHYVKHGGGENARMNPHKALEDRLADWFWLCDHFETEEFQVFYASMYYGPSTTTILLWTKYAKRRIFACKRKGQSDSLASQSTYLCRKMISVTLKCGVSNEVFQHLDHGFDKLTIEVENLLSKMKMKLHNVFLSVQKKLQKREETTQPSNINIAGASQPTEPLDSNTVMPFGDISMMFVPPIRGEFTNLLFQAHHETTAAASASRCLEFENQDPN
uniref:Protein FAR1-RELATED SEQUENCE n=1 Tax=Oryza rufipogon TaxID=4529 RepID=A0A0E0NVT9_ORYRU